MMRVLLEIKGLRDGGDERWNEIIDKYGLRIWNGDKIDGELALISSEGFTITGDAVGGEYPYDKKTVLIERSDIVAYKMPGGEWAKDKGAAE
jgi:hypothetical protein